ncbi:MAG: hypothetical protein EPO39_17870 [Candidatus Manganitrophaceae bacterium]|nr:MAG: hypothetical protein EPO39_17870 [Candidatus Manganitrophaceae bacterium]
MGSLKIIGMNEMNGIFSVTDRLGISREAIVVPLGPASPGRVRRLPSGKFEITVDADQPMEAWLPVMEKELVAFLEG